MKPGAGKRKGSAFEREIAKKLSRWLTRDADSTQLIRSVLSGGWSGRDGSFRQVGDLSPNGPVGEKFRRLFSVECKHQRDISLWQLWTGGKLLDWWDKLEVESANAGLWPLLIVRQNGKPITVFTTTKMQELVIRVGSLVTAQHQYMAAFPLEELTSLDPDLVLSMKGRLSPLVD